MKPVALPSVCPDDVSLFFNLSTLASLSPAQRSHEEPFRRNYYQIIGLTRGRGTFEIDLETLPLEANTIYTIPPGRFHQLLPLEELEGYVLGFNANFLQLAIEGPGTPFFNQISAELSQVNSCIWDPAEPSLPNVLAEIRRELDTNLTLRLEILTGLLKLFLIHLKRQGLTCRLRNWECEDTRIFSRFYSQLDSQFKRTKQVAEYARELFVSPGHLNAVIKRVTGYPASYHIRQRTIQEAKRMVIYHDANLKTVAGALGFDDMAHFSKYFKTATGMTFSEFRRRNLERTNR